MKKFFVVLIMLAFVAGLFGTAFAQTQKSAAVVSSTAPSGNLVSLLPASDAVMKTDMARLMNALPAIAQSNPEFVRRMNAKFDDVKSKTGIDLRQFEQIAVGVAYKRIAAAKTDFEPVIFARGKFDTAALTGAAKLAAKGKYREEKLGERTIYVFAAKEIAESYRPQNPSPRTLGIFDMIIKRMSSEIAMTAFDSNTIVMGGIERLKSVFAERKTNVAPELTGLLNRRPNAAMSFAMNLPEGALQFVNIEMDEIGKNLADIRQAYGAIDFADNVGTVNVNVVSKTPAAASGLEEMVKGLQMLGTVFLGNSQSTDKKVYAKLVEKAVISRQNNTVTVDLQIPQADINSLMSLFIK